MSVDALDSGQRESLNALAAKALGLDLTLVVKPDLESYYPDPGLRVLVARKGETSRFSEFEALLEERRQFSTPTDDMVTRQLEVLGYSSEAISLYWKRREHTFAAGAGRTCFAVVPTAALVLGASMRGGAFCGASLLESLNVRIYHPESWSTVLRSDPDLGLYPDEDLLRFVLPHEVVDQQTRGLHPTPVHAGSRAFVWTFPAMEGEGLAASLVQPMEVWRGHWLELGAVRPKRP